MANFLSSYHQLPEAANPFQPSFLAMEMFLEALAEAAFCHFCYMLWTFLELAHQEKLTLPPFLTQPA